MRSSVMTKGVVGYVLGSIVIGVVILSTYVIADRYFTLKREHDFAANNVSIPAASQPNSIKFLGQCSNIEMSNDRDMMLIAMSGCLGRVRGFVEGYNLTKDAVESSFNTKIQLWCIPPDADSHKMLVGILDWVDNNPQQYDKITNGAAPENQAMIMVVAALHAMYPCINS